jgi:anti-anti-sigma factor
MKHSTRRNRFALEWPWAPALAGTGENYVPLQLELTSQHIGNVAVVRCRGRITAGDEIRSLQSELEKITLQTKNVVLHLEEVSYLDSAGLGGIVRCLGMLRAGRGDLKLCQVSPFVLKVLQSTNLHTVFESHGTENEAMKAFSAKAPSPQQEPHAVRVKVLCVDPSSDILAYLSAFLQRSGFEIFTTRILSDAVTLLKATRLQIVIVGPAMQGDSRALEMLKSVDPKVRILPLPADFSTAEASQAGLDLVERLRSLQKAQP